MLLNQGLILAFGILIIAWLGILSFFLYRTVAHYKKMTQGIAKQDLQTILEKNLKEIELSEQRIDEIVKKTESLEKNNLFNIQKTGLIRFNPYSDTGGSQSFTLALLDGNKDGLLISSLHSRDQTRIYAKLVKAGKPIGYEFSKEEQEAIVKACK
jgi:hypothetical protein